MGALYIKIRDELIRLIEDHVYRVGDTLPSDEELAETFGVSRPTVSRAIQMLVDEGRLEKRPYRGTTVCPPKIEQGFTAVLRSFDTEMRSSGRIPCTRVLIAHVARASGEVALKMEIERGSDIFKLVRLRYADDRPNVLVTSYIPFDLYPTIVSVDFTCDSLYDFFESCGKPVTQAHRRLDLLRADRAFASVLDVAEFDPLYRFSSVVRTQTDRVAEYAVAVYRGDSNAFEFDTAGNAIGDLTLVGGGRASSGVLKA